MNFMIQTLKTMDEKQLLELFHDISDLNVVSRIADCAYHYIEHQDCEECEKINGKSEQEDWKEEDDKQRYQDVKSAQDNYK